MLPKDRYDRGALLALGMSFVAVLLVLWFQAPSALKSHLQEPGVKSMQGSFDPFAVTIAEWIMAVLSFATVCISFYAVRLLGETLAATRDAVRSADDAVKVTQDIGEKQSRAWLVFQRLRLEFGPAEFQGVMHQNCLNVKAEWLNCGMTPAADVSIHLHLDYRSRDDSDVPEFSAKHPVDDDIRSIVGPKGVPLSYEWNILPLTVSRMIKQEQTLYFYTVARYETVQRKRCQTEACGRLVLRTVDPDTGLPEFVTEFIGPQNGVSEEPINNSD